MRDWIHEITVLGGISIFVQLAAVISNMIAILVVLFAARDRRVARSFAAMSFCLAVWHLLLVAQLLPNATLMYPRAIHYLRFGLILLPATVFHSAFVWSGTTNNRLRQFVMIGYAVAMIISLLHARHLLVDGFIIQSWGAVGRAGQYYPLFILYTIALIGLGCLLCFRVISQPIEARVRLRAQYWFLGSCFAFPLGLGNIMLNYDIPIFLTSGIGNIILVSVMGYAAARHEVMEIDAFVMKAVGRVVALAAVSVPVMAAAVWTQTAVFGVSSGFVTTSTLVGVFLGVSMFGPFRSYLEKRVERSFFPRRKIAREAIEEFSRAIVEFPRPADLSKQLASTLVRCVGTRGVALYLGGERSGTYVLVCSEGSVEAPAVLGGTREIREITAAQGPVLLGKQAYQKFGVVGPAGRHKRGWEACVPVRAARELLGFIALGPKRSGARMDEADVTLLTMVSAQAAIALKNAAYLDEVEWQKTAIEKLQRRIEAENVCLREEVRSASPFKEIIGSSIALQRALSIIERTAQSEVSIMITGETGTGKELMARAIHEFSLRRGGPLVCVNCPAIPDGLAESEFFGHERGAFTDAVQAQTGKFEQAHGGTIFFDEVADLPLHIQVKLLRALQEKEIQRIGSRKTTRLDVRVVSATNRDLRTAVRARAFREDLYHRLAGVEVRVPALRERAEDIPMLASFFLGRAADAYQRSIAGFAPDAMATLCAYNWPGNIRELQNVIERAVLLCGGSVVRAEHLLDLGAGEVLEGSLSANIRGEKERQIMNALRQTGGNQAAAARLLGMSRSNLNRLIRTLGLKYSRVVQ